MLKHCLVGALSVFLVQYDGNTDANAITPQNDDVAHKRSAATQPGAAIGKSVRFLNRTWCFGQQEGSAQCDITLAASSDQESGKAAGSARAATEATAPEDEAFAWRFELWERSICLGAVPNSTPCDFRLKPKSSPSNTAESSASAS